MVDHQASIVIDRPSSEVFALLDDEARTPEWLVRCVELRRVDGGPKSNGSPLHYTYKEGARVAHMDGQVDSYEPDQLLTMRFSDARFDVDIGFRLSAREGATVVEHSCRIQPRSFGGRLVQPLIRLGLRRQMPQDLARLKNVAERTSAS